MSLNSVYTSAQVRNELNSQFNAGKAERIYLDLDSVHALMRSNDLDYVFPENGPVNCKYHGVSVYIVHSSETHIYVVAKK